MNKCIAKFHILYISIETIMIINYLYKLFTASIIFIHRSDIVANNSKREQEKY